MEQPRSKYMPDTFQSTGTQVLGVQVHWQMPALATEADIPAPSSGLFLQALGCSGHLSLVWAEAKPEGFSLCSSPVKVVLEATVSGLQL